MWRECVEEMDLKKTLDEVVKNNLQRLSHLKMSTSSDNWQFAVLRKIKAIKTCTCVYAPIQNLTLTNLSPHHFLLPTQIHLPLFTTSQTNPLTSLPAHLVRVENSTCTKEMQVTSFPAVRQTQESQIAKENNTRNLVHRRRRNAIDYSKKNSQFALGGLITGFENQRKNYNFLRSSRQILEWV